MEQYLTKQAVCINLPHPPTFHSVALNSLDLSLFQGLESVSDTHGGTGQVN